MRIIITNYIMGELSQICLMFIQNKFPLTFRSAKDYIVKSKMHLTEHGVGTLNYFQ